MDNLLSASVRYLFVFFFVQSKKNSEAIKKKEKKKVRVVIVLLFPRAGKLHRCPYQWINNCSRASSTFPHLVFAQQSCNDGPAVNIIYRVLHCVCIGIFGDEVQRWASFNAAPVMSFFFSSPLTDWIYLVAEKERERDGQRIMMTDTMYYKRSPHPPPIFQKKKF